MNEYHNDTTRISKSGLDLIRKAPRLYEFKYLEKNAETDSKALLLGRAFHDIILQPDLFSKQFVIKPEFHGAGSRVESEKWDHLHRDKDVLTLKEYAQVIGMKNSVFKHPKASKLLSSGIAEKTFYFTEPMTGAKCKIRPDFISDMNFVVDLKSTEDASEYGMKKSIRKFRYDVQNAFYMDGLESNGISPKGFIFIFVEKTAPYLVNLCVLSNDLIEHGRNTYQEDLFTYVNCLESGEWGGYGDDIVEIGMDW